MSRSNLKTGIVALVAVVMLLAGCGVSADTVVDALPDRPGTATTVAPSTTATPGATAVPSTTDEPSPTDEPSTTEARGTTTTEPTVTTTPDSTTPGTGGSAGSLPAEARDAFMNECTSGGQTRSTCDCIWGSIEGELDVNSLMEAGSSGSLPPDLQQKIIDATMSCMFGN